MVGKTKVGDREKYLAKNPNIQQVITAPNINKGGVGDRCQKR